MSAALHSSARDTEQGTSTDTLHGRQLWPYIVPLAGTDVPERPGEYRAAVSAATAEQHIQPHSGNVISSFGIPNVCFPRLATRRLKNTTETHKPTSAARHLVAIRTFILFLCLICGPVFAILISVLSYSNPTPDSLAKANEVKKASTTNLLFASAFLFLLASWCCVTAVRGVTLGVGSVSWHQHPHIMVRCFRMDGYACRTWAGDRLQW